MASQMPTIDKARLLKRRIEVEDAPAHGASAISAHPRIWEGVRYPTRRHLPEIRTVLAQIETSMIARNGRSTRWRSCARRSRASGKTSRVFEPPQGPLETDEAFIFRVRARF